MITSSNLTHGNATDSGSESLGDQTTASIAPTNNSLVLVAIGSNHPSGTPNQPTVSGLSMTWTLIGTIVLSAALRMTLYRGVANGNSGTLTISHGGQNQQNIYWGVTQVDGANVSGTNGENAIVQSATGSGIAQTTFNVTLGAFTNIVNGTYGAVYQNTSSPIDPGSDFTEIGEARSSHALESEYKTSNDTSVDWSVSGAANYVAIAVELKAMVGGNFIPFL